MVVIQLSAFAFSWFAGEMLPRARRGSPLLFPRQQHHPIRDAGENSSITETAVAHNNENLLLRAGMIEGGAQFRHRLNEATGKIALLHFLFISLPCFFGSPAGLHRRNFFETDGYTAR
jgi:hypothetical protein